jgi:predicted  nucleic acid-binding Zn-ribbon protein
MHPAQRLHRLQQTDLSLAKTEDRLAEIHAMLGESQELRETRLGVQSTELELERWQATLRGRELEVQDLSRKIKASEDHVYGGRVRNPKELKNLEEELLSFRRRRESKEDAVLEAMLEVEQLTETLTAQKATLAVVEANWSHTQGELLAEQEALRGRREDLLTARRGHELAVGDHLELYEELRRRRAGQAVALLRDGVCHACGLALPTGEVQRVKYAQEICRCSSCGRILWAG